MLDVSKLVLERYFQAVFQPLDMALSAGQLLFVTGDNGSGKTTLLRLLAGIIQPTSGTIRHTADRIALLGHELAIKEDLSSLENLQFVRDFNGHAAETATVTVEQALQLTGLKRVALQPARTLSAGQRKRCALARLLLQSASLWLLDEPYSNLDQAGIELVDSLLLHHIQKGGSAVVATHGEHRPDIPHQELAVIAGFVH